jgi:hypothetical protein
MRKTQLNWITVCVIVLILFFHDVTEKQIEELTYRIGIGAE